MNKIDGSDGAIIVNGSEVKRSVKSSVTRTNSPNGDNAQPGDMGEQHKGRRTVIIAAVISGSLVAIGTIIAAMLTYGK